MVTIIYNIAFVKRVEFKYSHQKKKANMWGDRCFNELDRENSFTLCVCVYTIYIHIN